LESSAENNFNALCSTYVEKTKSVLKEQCKDTPSIRVESKS